MGKHGGLIFLCTVEQGYPQSRARGQNTIFRLGSGDSTIQGPDDQLEQAGFPGTRSGDVQSRRAVGHLQIGCLLPQGLTHSAPDAMADQLVIRPATLADVEIVTRYGAAIARASVPWRCSKPREGRGVSWLWPNACPQPQPTPPTQLTQQETENAELDLARVSSAVTTVLNDPSKGRYLVAEVRRWGVGDSGARMGEGGVPTCMGRGTPFTRRALALLVLAQPLGYNSAPLGVGTRTTSFRHPTPPAGRGQASGNAHDPEGMVRLVRRAGGQGRPAFAAEQKRGC